MRLAALAPLVAAAALAVVPAPAAHASCTDDLLAKYHTYYFSIDPDYFVEVNGLDVTVHTGNIVALGFGLVGFAAGEAIYVAGVTPGAVVQFANCVV